MIAQRASSNLFGWLLALAVSACTTAAPNPEPKHSLLPQPTNALPRPDATVAPSKRVSDRFAVAAENASAVAVAREVLEEGGSAADAAIAGALVGCAAHASSCGLGGGGAALVWSPTLKATFVDFREVAPHGIRPSDYTSKNPSAKKRGVMTGVPGLVAGLAELHRLAGTLPWSKVIEKAAHAVEVGLPLSAYMAQALVANADWLAKEERASILGPADARDRIGETQKNPALVATLRAIATGGKDAFYSGAIASDVVDTASAAQSRLVLSDLTKYRAIVREPLAVDWEGSKILTAPPPSGSGLIVAEMFGMFSRADLRQLELRSGNFVHALAEAFRSSYQDRTLVVGDPEFFRPDAFMSALDPSRLKARRAAIKPDATTMPKIPSIAESGTFQIITADAQGSVVTLTASLTNMFGARLVTKGGYALNDALSDFTIDEYGQHAITRGPNAAKGSARPASNLAPTLVLGKDGTPIVALGGTGGLRGGTGVVQVLMAHLAFDEPLPDAVSKPRFHVSSGGLLNLDSALEDLASDLSKRGEVVDAKDRGFGAVTALGIRLDAGLRVLEPVFDPRRGGAVTIGHGEPVTNSAAHP